MKREELDWGVRLTLHPFAGLPVNSEMYIQADIKGSEIKIWFTGTTVRHPLRRGDAVLWLESLKTVFDAALAESRGGRQ